MTRSSNTRQLEVWMNGQHVGTWKIELRGRSQFNYSREWLDFKGARPISLSMPLRAYDVPYTGEVVEAYFDNLLPDSTEIRRRIQTRYRTASINPFDLLSELGRDCIGAIQLLPAGQGPEGINQIQCEALNESDIANILRNTVSSNVLGQDIVKDFRISVAGAQEKTALLKHKDQWCRPLHSTPTTHLLKLPIGNVAGGQIDMSSSVENEWLCAQITRQYGLDVAASEIMNFEDQHVLVVERFDRMLSSDSQWWMRLPQEDMCQALGMPPERKYQNDGGPGIIEINKLLMSSDKAIKDRLTFFKAQVLFWMLCAIDGHAKNFSIAIKPNGHFSLTPLYDILSAYPILGRSSKKLSPHKAKMAMAAIGKNTHYKWNEITPRHWISTAEKCGLEKYAHKVFAELIDTTPIAIAEVEKILPASFPENVATSILKGLQTKAKALSMLLT